MVGPCNLQDAFQGPSASSLTDATLPQSPLLLKFSARSQGFLCATAPFSLCLHAPTPSQKGSVCFSCETSSASFVTRFQLLSPRTISCCLKFRSTQRSVDARYWPMDARMMFILNQEPTPLSTAFFDTDISSCSS